MNTICILYRQTRQGLSTFRFVKCEDGSLWMFGGCTPKAIEFDDMSALKSAITQWRRYGFSFTKPQARPAKPAWDSKKFDPWSELPMNVQQELWSLA